MLRKNFIHGTHGGNGSSDFIRNLNGYFGVARAQEILEEIFFKNGRGPEIIMDPRSTRRARIIGNYPRNYLGSCFARNLWRKSLIKIWPMARN